MADRLYDDPNRMSRRAFLRDVGAGALVAGELLASPSRPAATGSPRRTRRPRVAVLGGGVAGLTAAHELAQRGFNVCVYERKALGGKARSIPVARSATERRRPLPGEHGFRILFGFYHNLPDTLRRIPFGRNPGGVHDNLVDAGDFLYARDAGREAIYTGLVGPIEPLTPDAVRRQVVGAAQYGLQLERADEPAFLARQLAMYMASCDERRLGEWEHVSWWDYMRAGEMSDAYQKLIVRGVAEIPNALKSRTASSRTVGGYVESTIYTRLGRGGDGSPIRVLNAPTNEAWIDPWILELRRLGVRFRVGYTVESLALRRGRIVSARIRDRRRRSHTVGADWFVCALPLERARALWSPAIRASDPQLERMDRLETGWLTGIQFFLRKELPIHHGHVAYIDSPWRIASISQAQFWDRDINTDYGNGQVRECLSASIGNWDEPGPLFGKPARACAPKEIAREVWAQIKAALEPTGRAQFPDELLHSWFLDPGIAFRNGHARNDDPLFQNTIGSWDNRPHSTTEIANLVLAGDYVRTGIDVATMEGANESARTAVNAILHTARSQSDAVPLSDPYRAPELEQAKRIDADRYKQGRSHVLDTLWP